MIFIIHTCCSHYSLFCISSYFALGPCCSTRRTVAVYEVEAFQTYSAIFRGSVVFYAYQNIQCRLHVGNRAPLQTYQRSNNLYLHQSACQSRTANRVGQFPFSTPAFMHESYPVFSGESTPMALSAGRTWLGKYQLCEVSHDFQVLVPHSIGWPVRSVHLFRRLERRGRQY